MSILTNNRTLALQAYRVFAEIPQQEEAVKHYLNAVQQALLKLETQGMRRCMLYITSQMGKKQDALASDSSSFTAVKAYSCLYRNLSVMAAMPLEDFQYQVLKKISEDEITLLSARVSFFLLCLKRLANAQISINDATASAQKLP